MGVALDRQVEQIGDRLPRPFGACLAGCDEPPQRAQHPHVDEMRCMQCESMAGEVLAHDVSRGSAED